MTTTAKIKPGTTESLTSSTWKPVTAPDYFITGYRINTTSGAGVYRSHNSDGDNPVFISDVDLPDYEPINNAETGAKLAYYQSEATTDTLNVRFVE